MDIDFWASRVSPAKYLSAVQTGLLHSDDHLYQNDSDGDDDDDARDFFSCPFCYVDIQVSVLCRHLQEEHCFDLKNAVCPICAGNLGKDVTGHLITHHTNSLKRRRKSETPAISAMLAKKLPAKGKRKSTPDPLLSPFICSSIPISNPEGIQKDECSKDNEEGDEEENEEKRQRAAFVQQLINSTISWRLSDSPDF